MKSDHSQNGAWQFLFLEKQALFSLLGLQNFREPSKQLEEEVGSIEGHPS